MSALKQNMAAGYVAEVWTGICALLFAPLYIHFIGIEGYGLIGFFTAMQALFGLLDLGINSTLNREVARIRAKDDGACEMRDLVRTLEIPYWLVGLGIAAAIIGLADVLATHWIQAEGVSLVSLRSAIVLMGCIMAVQWPIGLYNGGLTGLERQVWLNGIKAGFVTFQGVGAIVILRFVSPSIEAFFSWQLGAACVHTLVMSLSLWRFLPSSKVRPRFRKSVLKRVWKFAAGMSALTLLTTVLMHMDKVILSRVLSLEMFGYYSLASAVAISLKRCVLPVFTAVYPRFSHLVGSGLTGEISAIYHKSVQLVAALLLPASLMLVFFSREIVLLWTRNVAIAQGSYLIVALLVAGKTIYGLTQIPYALQLAYAWTAPAIWGNLLMVALMAPLMIVLANVYGGVGAAFVWPLLALLFFTVVPNVMHRRVLPGEARRFYGRDIGKPLLAVLIIVLPARVVIMPSWPAVVLLAALGVAGLAAFLAGAYVAGDLGLIKRIKMWVA